MSANTNFNPQPWSAQRWLASHDWVNENPEGTRISLWRRGADEVAVPLLTDAPDFIRRWNDLVEQLSLLERTTRRSIEDNIFHEGSDISEWRAVHSSRIDQTIPVGTLHALTGTVKASIVAAANATMSPRGYFGHSVPKRAREAANFARAGQTRRGSYVIPVMTRLPDPVLAPDEALPLEVELQPFQRQVMQTMQRGLGALHRIAVEAERAPSLGVINEVVGEGVSHELCSAIADTLDDTAIEALSVSFQWSSALRTNAESGELVFPAESRKRVREVADELYGSEAVGEQTLIGTVKKTELYGPDERASAVIRANLGGVERSIRMFLDDTQFRAAADALWERRPIYARGIVERSGGSRWSFNSVRDFGASERLSIEELERFFSEQP